jgi:hypothetical protein
MLEFGTLVPRCFDVSTLFRCQRAALIRLCVAPWYRCILFFVGYACARILFENAQGNGNTRKKDDVVLLFLIYGSDQDEHIVM